MSYLVEISKTGVAIKTFFVPMASNALDACDQTEKELGLKPIYGVTCPQTGKIDHIRWHGYMFTAKAVTDG